MKALVTGSSGFVGSALAAELHRKGFSVVLHHRDTEAPLDVRGPRVHGDLAERAFAERIVAEHEPDVVYHLAAQAQVSVANQSPVGTYTANVMGTVNVLEACRIAKTSRIVVASSDKCYGLQKPPYHEEMGCAASGPYETSKACADLIAQSYALQYGMSVAIVRAGNIYGPGQRNLSTLISGTIESVLDGAAPVIRSDGKANRDYLYIADAVAAYLAVGASRETGAFNIGMGKPESALAVVEKILDLMGSTLKPKVLNIARGEIPEQYLDASRARGIGWAPQWTLDEGLVATIRWHRLGRRGVAV